MNKIASVASLLIISAFTQISFSQPVTSHPRLWIRQQDLPRLRSWAVNSNPLWKDALVPAVQQAIQTYDTKFFPGGIPASPFPDHGKRDYELYCSEAYAEFFAFMSLMESDQVKRDDYARRARTLFMYVMNEAVKGAADDVNGSEVPFRGKYFSSYNRANYWGEAFGLTVDWIYPYLTTQEKQTIRTVFLHWASEQLTAYPFMRYFPALTNAPNDPKLLGVNDNEQYQLRWVANNYYAGHARGLTLMALSLDEADDPPVDPQQPITKPGNTLRSWITNITGGWLYQQYAMYEDSATVAKEYNYTAHNISLGKASGGIPVEGTLYGFSAGMVMQELLALYTAGYADVNKIGPQMKLLGSTFWDKNVDGFFHSITPASRLPYNPIDKYLGNVYEPACFGDVLRYWVNFQSIENFGPIALYDILTNNSARLAKTRWICKNALEGGGNNLVARAASVWSDVHVTYSILYFLMFDPDTPQTIDPRPGLPTDFYAAPIGRVLSRTDWTGNARWFTFLNPWETINHINETAGQFEFYRKGEWLTKQWSGYGNISMLTPEYFNTLSVKNDHVTYLNGFEDATDTLGGQWTNGMSSGDPATRVSFAKDYTFAEGIMTNLYNSRNAQDVKHVSRSIVWIKPDHLVIYDRAATGKPNRFKRFHCTLLNYPVINDRIITVTSGKGQQLFINSLLPTNSTITERHNWTSDPSKEYNAVAMNEPSKYRIMIEDITADTRFMTIFQGADAGMKRSEAQSFVSNNKEFEGAVIENVAVLFPRRISWNANVSYQVPKNVSGHVVTGLFPNTGYKINIVQGAATNDVMINPDGSTMTDSAGVLQFGSIDIKQVSTDVRFDGSNNPAAQNIDVKIYPNPATDLLHINVLPAEQNIDIRITDVLGKEIWSDQSLNSSITIDCSQFLRGCYFCFIKTQNHFAQKMLMVAR